MRSSVAIFGLILSAAARGAAAQTPEGEPLAVEAAAILPIDTESAVEVRDIQGQIRISSRPGAEMRILSRLPDGSQDLPVGIWQVGSKLIVAPPAGQAPGTRALRLEVPPGFGVQVAASDSDVTLDRIGGGITVSGNDSRVSAGACEGTLDAELAGGSLTLQSSGDATVRTRGTDVTSIDGIGDLRLRVSGGSVTVSSPRGATEIDGDEAKVSVDRASGRLHVNLQKGTAEAKEFGSGAEFELVGTPLKLKEGRGDITVSSDSLVEFNTLAGAFHADLYGGSLRGTKNSGILEVRTRNAEINVESIDGGMRVQGDGLKARLVDIGGDLYVEASVSDLVIDKATNVEVHLDRGSATIQRSAGAVNATVVGADVHVLDGIGSIALDLDGGDAEISWSSITGDTDSQIVNRSGSVTVKFPVSGSCRVEARSTHGRVDSDLSTVKVLADTAQAQGPVNGGYRPVIHISAAQDVHLVSGATAHGEN